MNPSAFCASYNAITPIHYTVQLRETDISLKGLLLYLKMLLILFSFQNGVTCVFNILLELGFSASVSGSFKSDQTPLEDSVGFPLNSDRILMDCNCVNFISSFWGVRYRGNLSLHSTEHQHYPTGKVKKLAVILPPLGGYTRLKLAVILPPLGGSTRLKLAVILPPWSGSTRLEFV